MPPQDEELKIINSGKFIGFIEIKGAYFPVFNHRKMKMIVAPEKYWLTMEKFLGCESPKKDDGYRYLIKHGVLNGNPSR